MDCFKNVSVFTMIPGRKCNAFLKPRDPLHALSQDEILMWVKEEHINCYFEE